MYLNHEVFYCGLLEVILSVPLAEWVDMEDLMWLSGRVFLLSIPSEDMTSLWVGFTKIWWFMSCMFTAPALHTPFLILLFEDHPWPPTQCRTGD